MSEKEKSERRKKSVGKKGKELDEQLTASRGWAVDKVMDRKPLAVRESVKILRVCQIMMENHAGQILVVPDTWDRENDEHPPEPIGIFTERDLIRALAQHKEKLVVMRVSEVMTAPIMSLELGEDLQAAANLMHLLRIRRIPIVKGGHLQGMVTRGRVMEAQRRRLQEMEEEKEDLEEKVVSDPLTGLANRLLFDQVLEREMKRRKERKGYVAMLMMDIDFFKNVNDTYGHPVGDIVLRKIAQIMRAQVRRADLVARIGGEEFAVILSQRVKPQAEKVAEKIRAAVEKETFGEYNDLFDVTVSLGVAFMEADMDTAALIKKSDVALYKAKQEGRNRVVVAK